MFKQPEFGRKLTGLKEETINEEEIKLAKRHGLYARMVLIRKNESKILQLLFNITTKLDIRDH